MWVQATTNGFFLFLGSPPGFLFTVTLQQGSDSLSLTVRALALAKEDRSCLNPKPVPGYQHTLQFLAERVPRVLIHCDCATGFSFTVTVTVSTTFLVTNSEGACAKSMCGNASKRGQGAA